MIRGIRAFVTHLILLGLSSWALYAQFVYRVPGWAPSLVLPWVGAAGTLLTLVVTFNQVVRGLAREYPQRAYFERLERVGSIWILAFVFCSLILFLNGKLDRSDPESRTTELIDIAGGELEWAPTPPLAWATLRSWRNPARTERLFLRPDEQLRMWGGQKVALLVRPGAFGIEWVSLIEPDEEAHRGEIIKLLPTAREAWTELAKFYLRHRRYDDVRSTVVEYVKRFPGDYEFPSWVASRLIGIERSADVIEILRPVAERHRRPGVYMLLGYAVGMSGKRAEGVSLLEAAIEMEPQNWWPYYALGWVYSVNGDFPKSVEFFEKTIAMRPGLGDVEYQLRHIRPLAAAQRRP